MRICCNSFRSKYLGLIRCHVVLVVLVNSVFQQCGGCTYVIIMYQIRNQILNKVCFVST